MIESTGSVETEAEICLSPALFAVGKAVESKLVPRRLVANARPIYTLRNGKYRNTTGHFELAVLDAGGRLVSELSPDAIGPHLHRIYGQLSLRSEKRVHGRVVVLTTPGARENYFHWCLELLPKIHLLRCSGLFKPDTDTFLVNHDGVRHQLQTLRCLGINTHNMVCTYPGIKITADQLVVPSHSARHEAIPRWSVDFLRQCFLGDNAQVGSERKLFLDRGSAKRRRLLNNAAVRNYLASRGYTFVDTAKMNFSEQVSLFRGARMIVSCHGAGLANLSFADFGSKDRRNIFTSLHA